MVHQKTGCNLKMWRTTVPTFQIYGNPWSTCSPSTDEWCSIWSTSFEVSSSIISAITKSLSGHRIGWYTDGVVSSIAFFCSWIESRRISRRKSKLQHLIGSVHVSVISHLAYRKDWARSGDVIYHLKRMTWQQSALQRRCIYWHEWSNQWASNGFVRRRSRWKYLAAIYIFTRHPMHRHFMKKLFASLVNYICMIVCGLTSLSCSMGDRKVVFRF